MEFRINKIGGRDQQTARPKFKDAPISTHLGLRFIRKIKKRPNVTRIPDEIWLRGIVWEILNGRPKGELHSVSHSWIEPVHNVINANGVIEINFLIVRIT
jgi:hypothetical protein